MSNERIDQGNIFEENLGKIMADIGQGDIEEMTRRYGEEEVARLIGEMMKNNEEIIKTQKLLGELVVEKRRQENREMERRREREQEETDRWREECRRKNEKEREEKEEQKRVDKEWRRIESMRKRVEISGDERKKEGREQTEGDGGKEMFWVWGIWPYGIQL